MKTKTPKSRKISAPNIQDSLGGAGSIPFKEYIDEKKAIDLNKRLRITLTTEHLKALNKVLNHYALYSAGSKHARKDVYKILKSLNGALDPIIFILSQAYAPSVQKSLQERLLVELEEIKANGLPSGFVPTPEDLGLDSSLSQIDASFLYDDESKNRILSHIIALKSATKSAIESLTAEESAHAGGRPSNPMQEALIKELKTIHDSACANKDSYGKEKRRDYFCAEILKSLPAKIRPKL